MLNNIKINSSKFLLLILITICSTKLISQSNKADSLLQAIKAQPNSDKRISPLINYCKANRYVYPDTCLYYINLYFEANHNVLTQNNIPLINYTGDIYWHLGNLIIAIEKYNLSLEFCKKINYKKGLSESYGNVGYIQMEQGKFPEALINYKSALKIAREINDEEYIGIVGSYIAQLYEMLGDYKEAVKTFHEMNSHFKKTNHIKGYSVNLLNLAAAHLNKAVYDSALFYYNFALTKLLPEQERSIAIAKINIAYLKLELGQNLKEVKKILDEASPIFQKLNSKSNITITNFYYGIYYIKIKDYSKAKHYLFIALEDYKSENQIFRLSSLYDRLSYIYEQENKIDSAYISFKLHKQFNDSMLIDEAENNMSYHRVLFETDKKQLEIQALEQKQLIQNKQLENERIQRFAMVFGIIILIVFGAFMFNRFRVTQKQKKIIEIKEIETQQQKHLIEEKHKEITDSINYAERIQRSFLATKQILDENLKDYFVFFQPKDIVSGDFYWATKLSNNNFVIVTADSTGHGVPGAIMSLLNVTSLEMAIKDGLVQPAEILNHTRKTIIERLKKDGSIEGGKDGMDASLVSFNFVNNKLIYSAANNPVWLVRENGLIEMKPDKLPIGKHDNDSIPFTQHEIELKKGDVIYTLTDGMPDQFGGPKGKKFMYKQLKELLISISNEPMNIQKQKLEDSLIYWKGNLEQVDDICVIGIRI